MVFGAALSPPVLAALSASLIVLGVLILGTCGDASTGAVAFAVCLGLGSGIASIAQGSLPLWLFGSEGYGSITGNMAAARLAASAAAPFIFARAMETVGIPGALIGNGLLGLLGVAAFIAVAASVKPPAAGA
jgi:hypothetical protein